MRMNLAMERSHFPHDFKLGSFYFASQNFVKGET